MFHLLLLQLLLLFPGLTQPSFAVVTILWWAFMVGFTAACFFLMSFILYGSASPGKDTMPYFVRNSAKYPAIFTQPGLGINCVSSSILNISIVIFATINLIIAIFLQDLVDQTDLYTFSPSRTRRTNPAPSPSTKCSSGSPR